MNYIIEAIIVGLYTSLIYLFFSAIIKNFYILLLVVGFFKHYLAHFIGLHTLYCNNSEACVKVLKQGKKYTSNGSNLFEFSIIESFMFLIMGLIFKPFFKYNIIFMYFIIGIVLHILAEKLLIHNIFCKHDCKCKQTNK